MERKNPYINEDGSVNEYKLAQDAMEMGSACNPRGISISIHEAICAIMKNGQGKEKKNSILILMMESLMSLLDIDNETSYYQAYRDVDKILKEQKKEK